MSGEHWKAIADYPDYEISDQGHVRRVTSRTCARAGHVLSSRGLRAGYPSVQLCRDGKRTSRTVHSLVAEAFIGSCPPGHEVNHIDGDKTHNSDINLEYVTRRANEQHAYRLGFKAASGERNGAAKLTTDQVQRIRDAAARPHRESYHAIARTFGISERNVRAIVTRQTWALRDSA